MDIPEFSESRARAIGLYVVLTCTSVVLVFSRIGFAFQAEPSDDTLKSIREVVKRNESLSALIKMDYKATFSRSDNASERPEPRNLTRSGNLRTGTERFTHYNGVWAQDGVRQHSSIDYYSADELVKGDITVVDGEVTRWGKKPDLMQGSIGYVDDFDWTEVGPCRLGIRPFEGKNPLSEILVPQYASVHKQTEVIDGRESYVVDARRPIEPAYFARIWIDRERGVPIRYDYYDTHPAAEDARLIGRAESPRHCQLPNGGWIPVEGYRSVFYKNIEPRVRSRHIIVDVNSITIRREDIPESLFTLTFPEGAVIHNEIIGITTGKGKFQDLVLDDISNNVIASLNAAGEPNASEPEAKTTVTSQGPIPPASDGPSQPPEEQSDIPTHVLSRGNHGFGLIRILLFTLLGASASTLAVWLVRSGRNAVGQGGAK